MNDCICGHPDEEHIGAFGECIAVDVEAFDTKHPRRHVCRCEGYEAEE